MDDWKTSGTFFAGSRMKRTSYTTYVLIFSTADVSWPKQSSVSGSVLASMISTLRSSRELALWFMSGSIDAHEQLGPHQNAGRSYCSPRLIELCRDSTSQSSWPSNAPYRIPTKYVPQHRAVVLIPRVQRANPASPSAFFLYKTSPYAATVCKHLQPS